MMIDAAIFPGACGDDKVRAAVRALGPAGGTVRLGPDGPDDASQFTSADEKRARRAWGWSSAVELPSNVTLLLDGAFVAILPPSCTRPVRAGAFPGSPRGFVQIGGGADGASVVNVRVRGRGGALVDGCAPFYYGRPHVCHNSTCHGHIVPAAETRPPAAPGGIGPQLVRVSGARHVSLEAVEFARTASWVAHFEDVAYVSVHKLVIRHAVRDGLHFGPGVVRHVSVTQFDSQCDDNNFALLGAVVAHNVTLNGATLRNGRTDAIRVGSFSAEPPGGAGDPGLGSIRGLRFLNVQGVDLAVLASLGLPEARGVPSARFGELSDILFENVTLSRSGADGGGSRLVQLLQPVRGLALRGVLLPREEVAVLVDHTRAHALPGAHGLLHPLDGLELSAEAPHGGRHRVQLGDRAARYSRIRMNGAPKGCPCECALHAERFVCSPPAAARLVGEAPLSSARALLVGAAQWLAWTEGSAPLLATLTLLVVGVVAAALVASTRAPVGRMDRKLPR